MRNVIIIVLWLITLIIVSPCSDFVYAIGESFFSGSPDGAIIRACFDDGQTTIVGNLTIENTRLEKPFSVYKGIAMWKTNRTIGDIDYLRFHRFDTKTNTILPPIDTPIEMPQWSQGYRSWEILVLDEDRQELIIVGYDQIVDLGFETWSFIVVISMIDFSELKNVSFAKTGFPLDATSCYDPVGYSMSWMTYGLGFGGVALISVDLKTMSMRTMYFDASDIRYSNQIAALVGDGHVFHGLDRINQLVWMFDLDAQKTHNVSLPYPEIIERPDCAKTDTPGQIICILGVDMKPNELILVDLFKVQKTVIPLSGVFGGYPFYVELK